jgi:CBS domain-containing protein
VLKSLQKTKFSTPGELLQDLHNTVRHFLNIESVNKKRKGHRPIVALVEDTLGEAIEQAEEYQIHRLYVVDDAGHPIAVLSLSDMIDLLISK